MATISEICLINADAVKKFTPVNGGVDTNHISAAIYLAQDKYIEIFLGSPLMRKMKSDINSWDGKYLELIEEHLTKAAAWWTLYELYPMLYVKLDNGALVIRQSDDTTGISDTQFENLRNTAQETAKMYSQRMIDWLIQNAPDLPEYNEWAFPDRLPKRNVYQGFGIVFTGSHSATSSHNYVGKQYQQRLAELGILYPYYNA